MMKKALLFIGLMFIISCENLLCQYWQEQIVLQGNVITQCFDENDDVLFSSGLSNGKYAVCRYSVEKDSIDKVLLVTNKPVNFLEMLSDGTIMAFQNYQLLRSTDKGESWKGISNKFKFSILWINYDLKEFNNSLILWEEKNHYISFDKGTTWRVLKYQDASLYHIEPTYNECLLAVEPVYKSPIFSSNYGLTWEKTNLDTLDLIGFIYSEINNTLYALTWPREQYFFKSIDGGKYWEKVIIANDTVINSYDIDSQGNLFIMDANNYLYKYIHENSDLQLISSDAPFSASALLPYFGKRYRYGIFLDKNDNIYYYDAIGFKFWKYDKDNKEWLDSVDVIHNDVHPYSFIRKGLTIANRAEKWLVNAESAGLEYVDLSKPKLKGIIIPSGIEPISEFYDLGPDGEIITGNFEPIYINNSDTLDFVNVEYSLSNDNGFSRKIILRDTSFRYFPPYSMKFNIQQNGQIVINNLGDIHILGYINNYRSTNKGISFDTISNDFIQDKIYKLIGDAPNVYLYLLLSDKWNYYTNFLYRSSDNGNTWILIEDSLGDKTIVEFTNNIQFTSKGDIYISESDLDDGSFANSTDFGETWSKHRMGGYDTYSVFVDSEDNVYSNAGSGIGSYLTYKNFYSFEDTCHVFASKSGDLFAKVYKDSWEYKKNIFSSDNGKTWVDFKYEYGWGIEIKSNKKGDIFWYNDDNLYKFIREPNQKPHPLSDTTVYTVIVDVEENEKQLAQEIKIYPNPASEYIEINIGADSRRQSFDKLRMTADGREEWDIQIYNVLGECVSNLTPTLSKGEGVIRVDVSNLPVGMYFVRVENRIEKFIKY